MIAGAMRRSLTIRHGSGGRFWVTQTVAGDLCPSHELTREGVEAYLRRLRVAYVLVDRTGLFGGRE